MGIIMILSTIVSNLFNYSQSTPFTSATTLLASGAARARISDSKYPAAPPSPARSFSAKEGVHDDCEEVQQQKTALPHIAHIALLFTGKVALRVACHSAVASVDVFFQENPRNLDVKSFVQYFSLPDIEPFSSACFLC